MSENRRSRTNPTILRHAKDLRREQTPNEVKLWRVLRNRQLSNLKFRRQVPIGSYIVDFYCAEARLTIEIDGDSHALQEDYDQLRTAWLETQGYVVIRFTNQDVSQQFDSVIRQIIHECESRIKR